MKSAFAALALASTTVASPALAETPLRVATWNIAGGEQTPAELETNARAAAADLGPLDVISIQEVVSADQVAAIARGFGVEHWAISDFSPPVDITGAWFRSLEVAVVSRMPIDFAGEWDLTGREPNGDGFAPRVSDDLTPTGELPVSAALLSDDRPSRGFLRVELPSDITVYTVHWKSSRGESCNGADQANALQREDQAAGLAFDLVQAVGDGRTVIVAGDLNIQAPGRVPRVGSDPAIDCDPAGACDGVCGPGGLDGYDDSISALLAADESVRVLSAELDATFLPEFFPGGAIDHLLVAGARAGAFQLATTPDAGDSYFGSDHRPVVAALPAARDDEGRSDVLRLIGEIRDRIDQLERLATE